MTFNPFSTATLTFEDTRFKDAEVKANLDVPLEEYLAFLDLPDLKAEVPWFAEHVLLSWNLTDKAGKQLPATAEGLAKLPVAFVRRLITAWMRASTDPGTPFDSASANGSASEGQ